MTTPAGSARTKPLKPIFFIPPAVVLLAAGLWLGGQRHTISGVEKESAALRKQIAARSGLTADPSLAKANGPAKAAKSKEPLDWKKIAAEFADRQGGDMRTMMRLQERLQAMSAEELMASLDEIAVLDLTSEARSRLEQMLLGPLSEKDPELALTKFIGRLETNQSMMTWQLSAALGKWLEKDPAKATAWFDREIAAGTFEAKALDGRSRSRIQFEGATIAFLLASDPTAAARRLGALPADQRDEVVSQHSFQQLKEKDQVAFAKLVRGQIPEAEQAEALARQAVRMAVQDRFTKAADFMKRIEATPAERKACVEEVAESMTQNFSHQKPMTREDFDRMRGWVGEQDPGSLGVVTGKTLATASRNGRIDFPEAAELAVQYHAAAGNDDVLGVFLESGAARSNKEAARPLVEKISDPARREKILERLK